MSSSIYSYRLASSISIDDDSSISSSFTSYKDNNKDNNNNNSNNNSPNKKQLQIKSSKSNIKLNSSNSVISITSSSSYVNINDVFLRSKYLEERAKKLRRRLIDRPYDERALIEYAEVTYEQKNFLISQKIIKRVIAIGENSGYWYLKLGKCCFRRWLIYALPADLDEALECYKIAMKDPTIHKEKSRYFEIAMMNMRIGRHQVTLDILETFMVLFKNDLDWVSIAEYIIALVIFTKGKRQEALELLRDLNISNLRLSIDRGPDHIFYLPYHINNVSIELEIATIHDAMGEKILARNLLYELWNQVEKYRKHGNTLEFDFNLNTTSFKEWYNRHQTFGRLGDMYQFWNNLIFASEMYRMALERILKLTEWNEIWTMYIETWNNFDYDTQTEALKYIIARAECLWNSGCQIEAEKCALFVFSKRPDDILLTGKAAKCVRPSNEVAQKLISKANNIERAILLVQSKARIKVARAAQKKREFAIEAEFIITSFLKMLLVRNRLVEDRLANCPVLHINALVKSLLEGRIKVMKSGKQAIDNWVEIWYLSAVTIQTSFQKWLRRKKYGRFFKGIRAFERVIRGQLTRTKLRKYIQAMQIYLDQNPDTEVRQSLKSRSDRRMNINYEIVTRICCGTTCVSSEEYILGTVPSNSIGSPLRMQTRSERKKKGKGSMLPPHRKPMWEKIEWFGDLAKRSPESISETNFKAPESRPYTAEGIKEFTETHPDEDIISFISYMSVKSDVTKQWVPFGILPEREIQRAVQCTILVITSPSFSCQDANRLSRTVDKYAMDSWSRLRSIVIYGTRMGPSGLRHIINLGISHLNTLTIGYTSMTHHFGGYIGGQLMQSDIFRSTRSLPQTIQTSMNISLYKIYIEQEPLFGDRGVTSLLKCLQANHSVKVLVFRGCNITNRGATACAKFIGYSKTIEIINLGENCLSRDGYLSLIRAVAGKGFRGKLQNVSICDQTPGYSSHEELLELYKIGNELGVKMVSNDITAVEETKYELSERKNTDEEDIKYMRKVFQDIVNDDRIENDEILTNSYKKIIYL